MWTSLGEPSFDLPRNSFSKGLGAQALTSTDLDLHPCPAVSYCVTLSYLIPLCFSFFICKMRLMKDLKGCHEKYIRNI